MNTHTDSTSENRTSCAQAAVPHFCSCCACPTHQASAAHEPAAIDPLALNRRDFLAGVSALTAGGLILASSKAGAASAPYRPQRRPIARQTLKVQPVLTYEIPQRREATSWRSWGGIQKEEQALAEKNWIAKELGKLKAQAEFPLEVLPVAAIKSQTQATELAHGDFDVMLIYAAGGGGNLLETLTVAGKWNLMFLRHEPGPVYLWYEIVSPRFLRKTVDDYGQPGWKAQDVVVDDHAEVLWRLRALAGLKNTLGKRMVCVGGASGWGAGGQKAPARTKEPAVLILTGPAARLLVLVEWRA